MGIIFDHPQDRPQPPRPQRRRRSQVIEEEERAPPLKRKRSKQPAVADPFVLTLFGGLQKLWRRQGTTDMRSSPDEAELWKQLARYLTKRA